VDRQCSLVWTYPSFGARDLADNQVKAFIVENQDYAWLQSRKDSEQDCAQGGAERATSRWKTAKYRKLAGLQQDQSFRETARVLKMTRSWLAGRRLDARWAPTRTRSSIAMSACNSESPIASFQMVQDLLARMIGNITASQCLLVRMAQLQAEGKLTDAHAAVAKAFTTSKCRETGRMGARSCAAAMHRRRL